MDKRRVALLSTKQLLGESLEHLLRGKEYVHLLGHWRLNKRVVNRLAAEKPDIILLAISGEVPDSSLKFIGQILERLPDVPLIQVELEHNTVRCYTSQTMPARSQALFDLIYGGQSLDESVEKIIEPEPAVMSPSTVEATNSLAAEGFGRKSLATKTAANRGGYKGPR